MKKVILLTFFMLFINNISFAKIDCSSHKKLSKEYLKCLGGKVKKKSSSIGIDTNNIKEKKFLTDWFKKKKWILKKIS